MNRIRPITAALLIAGLLLFSGCRGNRHNAGTGKTESRAFPTVQVPAMITEQDQIVDYVLTHFWDAFLLAAPDYVTDSLSVGGVEKAQIVRQVINYASLLENSPLDKAQKSINVLMDKLEACHDASPYLFASMTEMISGCLYDVNSELRDEDIYLPFVKRLASSPYTPESMVASYGHDAEMCALNARGTIAADFDYIDINGRSGHLHGINSEYTVLIFVNPGCHACGDVVEPFSSPLVMNLVSEGRLTVVGMYIDEEIETWMRGRDKLPSHWLNAYDPQLIIRTDLIYNVRAIPSVYVLDRDKRVVLKDAAPQRAVAFIESI